MRNSDRHGGERHGKQWAFHACLLSREAPPARGRPVAAMDFAMAIEASAREESYVRCRSGKASPRVAHAAGMLGRVVTVLAQIRDFFLQQLYRAAAVRVVTVEAVFL